MKILKSEDLKNRCNKLEGVDLSTKCRERRYVAQKKAFAMVCDTYFNDSYEEIGRQIGRDHSTISHYKKTAYFMDGDAKGYDKERKYFRIFRDLVIFDTPAGRIEANYLLGV
tara:strand:+ start:192 stop:527 length:336 start_codon:yes stop_codon:yes gene_type:complete